MVNVSEVGASCDIGIQGKYPLFSETQFNQLMLDADYKKQIDEQNNNQVYFRKEDTIIFNNVKQNTITLRLLNTISLQPKYSDFSQLLAKLSFKPENISVLGGNFKTFVTGNGDPQLFLNNILNPKVKSSLADKLNIKPGIISVVIANTDVTEVDMQIRMEPLSSSPKESLYIEFIFRTVKYDAFNDFIGKFGADFIKEVLTTIGEANGATS